jgi:hypothetical protein
VRTTRHDQDAAAVDDLDAALRELGVPFERSSHSDLVIRPGRRRVPVTLHSMAVASASSVAAPIADGSGEIIAAVHIHGPSYRFPVPGTEPRVAELVVTGAARIAAGLRER